MIENIADGHGSCQNILYYDFRQLVNLRLSDLTS
jgi:hypothetical protein